MKKAPWGAKLAFTPGRLCPLDSNLEVPLQCDFQELTQQLGTDKVSVRIVPWSVQFIYLI